MINNLMAYHPCYYTWYNYQNLFLFTVASLNGSQLPLMSTQCLSCLNLHWIHSFPSKEKLLVSE